LIYDKKNDFRGKEVLHQLLQLDLQIFLAAIIGFSPAKHQKWGWLFKYT
jgi:hypothetical protein